MTISTKTTIKAFFETNDRPTQSNFADLIDSYLGLAETSAQTIRGDIVVSGACTVSGRASFYGDFVMNANAASAARSAMGLGTAALFNVGVSANNIVQLDSQNRLPAVNGSLLTNVGAQVLLSTQTASNSATIDFTSSIDSTYKHYIIEISNLVPATGAILQALLRQGGSFVTGANYSYAIALINQAGSTTPSLGASSQTELYISGNTVATDHPSSFIVHIFQPDLTTGTSIFWSGITIVSTSALNTVSGSGLYNSAVATTGIRFLMSSGNIASGTFKLYGVS